MFWVVLPAVYHKISIHGFHADFESEDEIHHKLRREWFCSTLDASLEEWLWNFGSVWSGHVPGADSAHHERGVFDRPWSDFGWETQSLPSANMLPRWELRGDAEPLPAPASPIQRGLFERLEARSWASDSVGGHPWAQLGELRWSQFSCNLDCNDVKLCFSLFRHGFQHLEKHFEFQLSTCS